ncbi:MAG: hypothetical protein AAGC99_18990, partial [Pseudomonadota bacterium]
NRCESDMEADYEVWYQTEHLHERLSIPGFRRGRRYQALQPEEGYFTCYETDGPDVLTSGAYRERVDNPTPMTAHIMRHAFTDMSRTVCRQTFVFGEMRGAFAATLQMPRLPPKAWLRDWAGLKTRAPSIARIEGWQAIEETLPASTEAQIRGGDERIEACLFIETLRESDCVSVLDHLDSELDLSDAEIGIYRLLCELTSSQSSP